MEKVYRHFKKVYNFPIHLYSMNELYPSGSTLILFFSGISGSAFITDGREHIPVDFKDNKGYVTINKPLHKNDLINNYMFLKTDGHYCTKYKMIC